MIAAICIGWWIVGMTIFWVSMVLVDPVVTRSDAFVMILAGMFGPIAIIWLLQALTIRRGRTCDAPVTWLSLRR